MMKLRQEMLESELELVECAQREYKAALDRVIPGLLENAIGEIKEKGIAIELTGEIDSQGNYLNGSQKRNGSAHYQAFPEGIVRYEVVYEEGLPQTRPIPIPKGEFLKWVKARFDRTEDVYNRLRVYQNRKPIENNFPSDDIL